MDSPRATTARPAESMSLRSASNESKYQYRGSYLRGHRVRQRRRDENTHSR